MCLAFYSKLLPVVPSPALELLSHPLAIRAIRPLRKRQNQSGMSNGLFDYQPSRYLYIHPNIQSIDRVLTVCLRLGNGVRSGMRILRVERRSLTRKKRQPLRRPGRISMTSTCLTTTRRTSFAPKLPPKQSNFLRVAKTHLPEEQAGSGLRSSWMYLERAPGAVRAALERNVSERCCLISRRTRKHPAPAGFEFTLLLIL